jgi:hypothetical protein
MRSVVAVALLLASSAAHGAGGASLAIELSFVGNGGGLPPDTMGAVGPEHVLEVTNDGVYVHRKSDGAALGGAGLSRFWLDAGIRTSHAFDPRVVYDAESGRFFVVALDDGSSSREILLAVSRSSDPTDGFSGFAIDSDSADLTQADFPTIGVDADTVTIATDMHRIEQGGLPVAVDVWILPKADLLAEPPSIALATLFERAFLATTGFAPQPVTRLDGGGLPSWMLSTGLAFLGWIQSTRIDGTAEAPSIAAGPLVPIEQLPGPPDAEQPGAARLDTGDAHVASPVQVGQSIWAVHGVQGYAGRAAIRWLELEAATLDLVQAGVIESAELDYLYPSIAANSDGHVVIGFSASGASLPASAFAVLGETLGGETFFGEPVALRMGTGAIEFGSVSRFGDYSATVVDPTDPVVFWTFQEFSQAGSAAVAIAALRVVPEPAVGVAGGVLCALALVARRSTLAGARAPRSRARGFPRAAPPSPRSCA